MNNNSITCILTFKNEGIEVEKTIESILNTSLNTDILLIDDDSDDGYDYASLMEKYPVYYLRNKERKGVAESRNIGVAHSVTPYCLLLDAHMRFYEQRWETELIKYLNEFPESIICSKTVVIHKNEDGTYENEDGKKRSTGLGATINLDWNKERCFRHAWSYDNTRNKPHENLMEIPCVLGAAYAFRKDWWNKIRGLDGLIVYGLDEALMSIKTWMFGGKCYLKTDWNVGHIYRKEMPFVVTPTHVGFNEYMLANLFVNSTEELNCYLNNIKKRLSSTTVQTIEKMFTDKQLYFAEYKKFIEENTKMSFDDFRKNINK